MATSEPGLVGWTKEPSGRGTLGLIVSCLSTTFLCTWVIIHPRIDRRLRFRIFHKLALALKTYIAPEFIAVEAAQEWTQARRIRKQCATHTGGEFKLIHAFWLGMFGIRYRSDMAFDVYDEKLVTAHTKVLWPNQYVWLLHNGIITWDAEHCQKWRFSEEELDDKSNADSAAKLLAMIGVGKFTFDAIVRIYHHLPLAPLGSMTLGYIPLFALTYFFWWLKPKDVCMPAIVDLPRMTADERSTFDSLALTDAFDDEGKDHQKSLGGIWRLTPRDFELSMFRDQLPNMPKTWGQGAVLGNWDPDLYRSPVLWPVTCIFGVSFGALHLLCWNSVFPTTFEMWSWRVSAILSMAAMLVFMQFKQVVLQWSRLESQISVMAAFLYLLSRAAAAVEVFASLRASTPVIYYG